MANIKSAVKRAKQSEANRLRNRSCKSSVLTARKKVLAAIGAEDRDRLADLLALLLKSMEARQASETAGASGE